MPFPILNVFGQSSFNIGEGSVFVDKHDNQSAPFPPVAGNFELLDGTPFLLLDGTDFLLL